MNLDAYYKITRPSICFFEAAIALIGQILATGAFPESSPALLSFLAIFLITASGNVLNDYFDYEVDSVNTPWRPIPSGRISRAGALKYGVALGTIGITATLTLSTAAALLGLTILALTNFYSYKGKIYGLLGNIIIAFTIASCFLFGALTVTTRIEPFIMNIFGLSFLYVLGGEVIQSIADAEGDRLRNIRSIAIVNGPRTAAVVASICYTLMVIGGAYTAIQFSHGLDPGVSLTIIASSILMVTIIVVPLIRKPDEKTASRTRSIVNSVAFLLIIGLIVFLLL